MKTNKTLWAGIAIIICIIIAIVSSGSLQGGQNIYEVQPNLSIPEYKTDTARAIEAYERLMDRYMDLTGSHLTTVGMDLRNIVTRLDSIDARLTELDSRLMKIEQALVADKASKTTEKYPVKIDSPVNTLR
ncbi:MAG: hypothetical protein JXM79_00020 [Sedimentisphaerales bacterium]|nr:hypothetical protein [Sedimentisphaerales bacterium]